MTKVNYSRTSPYGVTPQSNAFIGRYAHRPILPQSDDVLMTLQARHQYHPEVLSQEIYGSAEYYWVFMCRNMNLIRDVIWDFQAGMTIAVPSSTYIKGLIG